MRITISIGLVALSGCSAFGDLSSASRQGLTADGELANDGVTDVTDVTDATEDTQDDEVGEGASCDCRFDRYNLDVRVGDTFLLTSFVSCGTAFALDGGSWPQIDVINAGLPITITEADLVGEEEAEYRVLLLDDAGDELDHATIRINHDDTSDIGPNDAAPRAPACVPGAGGGDDDDEASDDDGADDDGTDDDGTDDEGGANDDDAEADDDADAEDDIGGDAEEDGDDETEADEGADADSDDDAQDDADDTGAGEVDPSLPG